MLRYRAAPGLLLSIVLSEIVFRLYSETVFKSLKKTVYTLRHSVSSSLRITIIKISMEKPKEGMHNKHTILSLLD